MWSNECFKSEKGIKVDWQYETKKKKKKPTRTVSYDTLWCAYLHIFDKVYGLDLNKWKIKKNIFVNPEDATYRNFHSTNFRFIENAFLHATKYIGFVRSIFPDIDVFLINMIRIINTRVGSFRKAFHNISEYQIQRIYYKNIGMHTVRFENRPIPGWFLTM